MLAFSDFSSALWINSIPTNWIRTYDFFLMKWLALNYFT